MSGTRYGTAVALTVACWAGAATGRFLRPTYVPADRLIANATAYIQEHPQDASGYYTLARIHYQAFANKALLVAAFGDHTPPSLLPLGRSEDYVGYWRNQEAQRLALAEYGYASTQDVPSDKRAAFWNRVSVLDAQLKAQGWRPPQPSEDELVTHAGAAQWNFYKAIALDPNNALYYLGQASLGEQYEEYLQEACPALVPPAVKAILLAGVKETYLQAYQLAIAGDLSQTYLPLLGLDSLVGYEAGRAYVRLWEAEKEIPADVQEKIAQMKIELAKLEGLPFGSVTPIVFRVEANASLADLLAPERIVPFDLDGDGIVERRPWLKPTTALLVWGSPREGPIISGRQLFGSVTWRLIFSNGYRALDLLDDNRDGVLTGRELAGIAAWFDRNSDGRCDAGEVVSLESLGLVAIGTQPTGLDGKSPMHRSGIRLQDGRTLPSYDWIAPAAAPAPAPLRR